MAERRAGNTGEAAYQRLARRTEEAQAAANQRVEAMFDTMLEEVRGIREDVRLVNQKQDGMERRVSDLERQIIDTRDEVKRSSATPRPSQIASAKRAIKDTAKSPVGLFLAAAIALTTTVTAADKVPGVLRFSERFWAFLTGRDVVAVHAPPKVPEK